MRSASESLLSEASGSAKLFALSGLSLSVLLSTLNTSIINAGLPVLAEVFGATIPGVQWTVISYLLAITTVIVIGGRLADAVGRRRTLLTSVVVFTAAAGMCVVAPSLAWIIALRFLQGLGAAGMMSISVAIASDLAGKKRTGRLMGLLGSMSAVGTAVGPALGGFLVPATGWQSMFLINLPLGLITFGLLFRYVPRDPRWRQPDFDTVGCALLVSTLVAYALAMTPGRTGIGPMNVGLLVLAATGLILFVRVQRTAASPLLEVAVLNDRWLRGNLGMSLLVAAVMMSTLVVGPFYLSQALAVNPRTMGLTLSVGPLIAAVVAHPAGRLVDRFGTRRAIFVGLWGAALGCFALALLPGGWGLAGYLGPVAVMTAGYSLFQTANTTAVMLHAAADRRGVVSAMLSLSRNLGLMTGVSLLGAVFAFTVDARAAPPAEAIAFATRLTFAAATAFVSVGLVLAMKAAERAPVAAAAGSRRHGIM